MIHVKGKDLDWHADLTVRKVLKAIGYDFGNILVRVNNRIVPQEDWDSQHVPDQAKIDVHHIVMGG